MINFWFIFWFRFFFGWNYFIFNGLSVIGKIDVLNKSVFCYILCILKIICVLGLIIYYYIVCIDVCI